MENKNWNDTIKKSIDYHIKTCQTYIVDLKTWKINFQETTKRWNPKGKFESIKLKLEYYTNPDRIIFFKEDIENLEEDKQRLLKEINNYDIKINNFDIRIQANEALLTKLLKVKEAIENEIIINEMNKNIINNIKEIKENE